VACSPLVPDIDLPVYCADAYYLAEGQHYYSLVAAELLAELEAGPHNPSKWLGSLLADIANENCIVQHVPSETQSEAVLNGH
jgi:hypothetical protein